MGKRLKILVSAYACNPYQGSEEGVGWGWVNAIGRHHEVWVFSAEFHRPDIRRAVAADPPRFDNLHFHYVPHKPWHYHPSGMWRTIEDSLFKPIMHQAYRLWLRDAAEIGQRFHRRVGFDLVHQLTYVSFRFPGHLWKLNVPFVWGPPVRQGAQPAAGSPGPFGFAG